MKNLENTSLILLSLLIVSPAAATEGEQVYVKACAMCHNVMRPKFGDKEDWKPLVQQGRDALVAAVIKGKGAMPPNAGNSDLSKKDIEAAVDYMLSQVK